MDLLPIITNLLFYFLLALVLVLAFTFFYTKVTSNKVSDHKSSVQEERERVRLYLQNHPYYTKNTSIYTRVPRYTIPTYSDELRRNGNTTKTDFARASSGKKTRTSGDESGSRYSILNGIGEKNEIRFDTNSTTQVIKNLKKREHLFY